MGRAAIDGEQRQLGQTKRWIERHTAYEVAHLRWIDHVISNNDTLLESLRIYPNSMDPQLRITCTAWPRGASDMQQQIAPDSRRLVAATEMTTDTIVASPPGKPT